MKSVELFVGAGGLGIGITRAGFTPELVIERDSYCCDTIRSNQRHKRSPVAKWPLYEDDVRRFDFRHLAGKISLVSGGPPCQPFSIGGRHRAYEDSRDLFPEAVRALREINPDAFIFENVKGLTRERFASYFEYIKLQMTYPYVTPKQGEDWSGHLTRLEKHHTHGRRKKPYYRVVARVLNAANFGIPQTRERVFFIGFRNDLGLEWAFPEHTHTRDALAWDQVHGDYWERHNVPKRHRNVTERLLRRSKKLYEKPNSKPWKTVRDALAGLPDPKLDAKEAKQFLNHKYQPGARQYVGHTGSHIDEPAKTLKAGVHGVPGGENMLLDSNGKVRYFSVRESARIQTFPDSFEFHGSWSETMRQLGNAVPVDLAEILAKDVRNHLPKRTSR